MIQNVVSALVPHKRSVDARKRTLQDDFEGLPLTLRASKKSFNRGLYLPAGPVSTCEEAA